MDQATNILQSSETLFLRYGIRSVSMDDIARDLGISKKTLYQYVENKNDLIERIFEKRIQEEKRDMAQIVAESDNAVEEMLRIGNYVIEKLRQLSPTTMYDLKKYYAGTWKKMEGLHLRYVYELILENIQRGKREELYRPNIDADIIAKLYVAKTSLVVDAELFPPEEYNLETLFRQYIAYHLHGMLARRGRELMEAYMENQVDELN